MLIGLVGSESARGEVARSLNLLDGFVVEPVEKAWLKVVSADDVVSVCCPDVACPADALWVKSRGGFVVLVDCGSPPSSRGDWPFDWVVCWWPDDLDLSVGRVSKMVEALAWRCA